MSEPRGPFFAVPYDARNVALPRIPIERHETVAGAWGAVRGLLTAAARSFALYDASGAMLRIGVIPPEPVTDDADVSAMALDGPASVLATGHSDGNVRLWQVESGDPIWNRAPADESIAGVDLVERGPWVIAWSDDGPLLVFSRESGDLVTRVEDPQFGAFVAVPAPDGREIATTGSRVIRLDLPNGNWLPALDEPDPHGAGLEDSGVQWIEHLGDGATLVGLRAGEQSDELVFWSTAGARVGVIGELHDVAACDLSADRQIAVVCTTTDAVRLHVIDTAKRTSLRVITLPHFEVYDLRFAGTRREVLAWDHRHGIACINVDTGAIGPAFEREHCDVLYVPAEVLEEVDDRATVPLLITHDADGKVALTHLEARGPFRPLGRSVSRDGSRYAIIDDRLGGRFVTVFDVDRRAPLATLEHSHLVEEIAFAADGTRVAVRAGGHVTVWPVPLISVGGGS